MKIEIDDGNHGAMVRQNTKAWVQHPLVVFFFFTVILLLTYSFVLLLPYAYSDDYAIMSVVTKTPAVSSLSVFLGMGRPLQSVLGTVVTILVQEIDNLRYIRLIGVLGAAVFAYYLYRLLRRTGWNSVLSVCVPIVILTLPPFQITLAAYSAVYFVRPILALLACIAFECVLHALGTANRLGRSAWLICAVLLLLVILLTYQPDAMFYWVGAAILLLSPHAVLWHTFNRLLIAAVVMIFGLGASYVCFQILVGLFPAATARTAIVSDFIGKIIWFISEPLMLDLNFYNLDAKRWMPFPFSYSSSPACGSIFARRGANASV